MILGLKPFHIGIISADLDKDLRLLSDQFEVSLGEPLEAVMNVHAETWGRFDIPLRSAWARTGELLLEVTQARPGSIWDGVGVHHVGVWADDIEGLTERALSAGAALEVDGTLPGESDVLFRYLRVPTGLRIELVSDRLRPMLDTI